MGRSALAALAMLLHFSRASRISPSPDLTVGLPSASFKVKNFGNYDCQLGSLTLLDTLTYLMEGMHPVALPIESGLTKIASQILNGRLIAVLESLGPQNIAAVSVLNYNVFES
jgi:hypothetical protein